MSSDLSDVAVPELLRRLNSLRADVGKSPLKSWSASKSKLIRALEETKREAEAKLQERIDRLERSSGNLENHPLVKEERAREAAKGKKGKTIKEKAIDHARDARAARENRAIIETFTLAELAKELDIDPKKARARARKNAVVLSNYRAGDDGWVFKSSHRAAVTKIIRG